jgi:hypothetical protein
LRRDAGQVAALPVLPVDERRVLRDAVVPHDDGALLPLDARLEVAAKREVVVQELEQRVRLFLFQAYNVARDCMGALCQSRCLKDWERRWCLHWGFT